MKKIALLTMVLILAAAPLAAVRATSLTDLADKPEPAPREMPAPVVEYIPRFSTDGTCRFLGRIILPDEKAGLGYEYSAFSSDPWEQAQALIAYDNLLIGAGYKKPYFDKFDGDNMEYLRFTADAKPDVYVLPYLKKGALVAVIIYPDDILAAFPEELSAEDALAALTGQLDNAETPDDAARVLATVCKTSEIEQAVTDRITPENMDAVLPALIRADYFNRYRDTGEISADESVRAIGTALRTTVFLPETQEGQLAAARKAAETVLPAVDERYLQVGSLVWISGSSMRGGEVTEKLAAIPAFDKGAELPDDLRDDGEKHKYAVVCEQDGAYRLLPYHAVFLPADEIAESVEAADRIIVCHNYYKKSSGNWIGGTPSDSMTRILLYDKASGSLVGNLGYVGNYQGMVSHGGLDHNWKAMGGVILDYFTGE